MKRSFNFVIIAALSAKLISSAVAVPSDLVVGFDCSKKSFHFRDAPDPIVTPVLLVIFENMNKTLIKKTSIEKL